jgi:hypothetical protein
LNLLAAWVFHLYDQHVSSYKRILRRRREDGVDIESAEGPELRELRDVANTVKHGEDRRGELRKLRPELFHHPEFARRGMEMVVPSPARAPMAGDGLFVTEADLDRYEAAVLKLWELVISEHTAKP